MTGSPACKMTSPRIAPSCPNSSTGCTNPRSGPSAARSKTWSARSGRCEPMPSARLTMERNAGVLRRYADRLPLTEATPRISLGEGSTPLVRSQRIVERTGLDGLYFKMESQNPTASFKDRGMVVAVAKAMEAGARAVLCASTGNTSASAAAYAACCGLECYVFLPRGYVAPGKLSQTVAYGAQIVAIDGNFDDALRLARASAARHPIAL